MANIKLAIVPVNITAYLIIVVERVDDLGTTVYQHPALGPAPGNQNITVPNVPPVMLRFFFWESADGVSLDTTLGSADIDGSLAYDALVMLYEFEVGRGQPNDPADLADTYMNADLIGADLLEPGVESTSTAGVYTVEQKGAGTKFFGELTNNPVAGGFTLNAGDKFSAPDRWIVTLYKKVQSVAAPASSGFPGDLVTITAQVTVLDATYRNKELEIFSAFSVVTLTQEDLGTVPDGTYLIINTHRFTGNYVFLNFAPGGGLYYDGQLLSSFWIPANAVFGFTVKGHNARAMNDTSRASERGVIIGSYSDRRGYIRAIGTEYTKAAMPGLYQYVKDLPPGVACSFADWILLDAPSGQYFNKSRWAIDEALEKIIVPDMRNLHRRFLKLAADATRPNNQPGSLQLDNVKSHDHRVRGNFTSGNYDGGGNDFFRGRVGTAFQDSDFNEATGGTENTVLNAGEIPLITL